MSALEVSGPEVMDDGALARFGVVGEMLPAAQRLAARDAYDAAVLEAGRAAEFPRPEVTMRNAHASEIPRTAGTLLKLAIGCGWRGRITYARGWWAHARTGRPTKVVDSIAVRLVHPDGRRGVGLWQNGGWTEGWVVAPLDGRGVPYRLGADEFKAFVRGL